MKSQFDKARYNDNPGYRLLHVKGAHAGDSPLPYLHYSPNFMLLYFKHGIGSIKIEGRHYDINEGDIILLNPSELFQYYRGTPCLLPVRCRNSVCTIL